MFGDQVGGDVVLVTGALCFRPELVDLRGLLVRCFLVCRARLDCLGRLGFCLLVLGGLESGLVLAPTRSVQSHLNLPVVIQVVEFLRRVAPLDEVLGYKLLPSRGLLRVAPLGQLVVQLGQLALAPFGRLALLLRLLTVGKNLTFLNCTLVVGVSLLEGRVLDDPLGLIGTGQFGKRGLITDELRLQASENRVQVVGVVTTLRCDTFPFGLRFALGFCGFSRLATVVCVLHLAGLPGQDLGLLGFHVAKVVFRVVVLDNLRLFGGLLGFLALFGSFLLLGLLFLLLGLFGAAHQEGNSGFVASLAVIAGELFLVRNLTHGYYLRLSPVVRRLKLDELSVAAQDGQPVATNDRGAEKGSDVQIRPMEGQSNPADIAVFRLNLQENGFNVCPSRWASVAFAYCPVATTDAISPCTILSTLSVRYSFSRPSLSLAGLCSHWSFSLCSMFWNASTSSGCASNCSASCPRRISSSVLSVIAFRLVGGVHHGRMRADLGGLDSGLVLDLRLGDLQFHLLVHLVLLKRHLVLQLLRVALRL